MSARRPKLSPSKRQRKPPNPNPPTTSSLVLVSEAPRTRLPPMTAHLGIPRHQTILALPVRKSYVQIQRPRTHQSTHTLPAPSDPFTADDDSIPNEFTNVLYQYAIGDPPSVNAQKRQRQWRQWQDYTIPSLIQPYKEILRKTQSLREEAPTPEQPRCTCMRSRLITVLCLYFNRTFCPSCSVPFLIAKVGITEIELMVCTCAPAATQLMERALFPCAPLYPTLAVDLSLLDFVKKLFLRLPPNLSGWCEALEDFLDCRGYRLKTQVRPISSQILAYDGDRYSSGRD